MAARQPFWKWRHWKSIGFCLSPPSTCIWNLKLKFERKLDLCSRNHVVYRQTDRRTDRRTDGRMDGRTRWIQYTPLSNFVGRGYNKLTLDMANYITTAISRTCLGYVFTSAYRIQQHNVTWPHTVGPFIQCRCKIKSNIMPHMTT